MRIFNIQKSKIQEVKNFLRLRPFDTTTSEGRASERKRRATLTASSMAVAHSIRILITLITVPLLLSYLGNERYGMWLTISSLIAIIRFADFGIGNGLLNAISEADGKGDIQMALRAVSSASLLLSLIALALGVVFGIAYQFVPWQRVFNVSSSQAIQEAGPAIAVFALCFLMGIPLAVAEKTQKGYQEGFWNDFWLTVGNILALVGIMFAMQLQVGTPGLILALVGAPVVAMFFNGLVLFGIRRPWLRPKLFAVSRTTGRRLANLGIQFFLLYVASGIAFTSDRIVIAQILGAEMVPNYAVPQRLFALVVMLVDFIVFPLWPAYGEALARGDVLWIKATLFRSTRLVLLVTIPTSLFLILFGSFLIDAWVGQAVQPNMMLLIGLGLWTVIVSVGNAYGVALGGMSILRIQVILAIIMAPVNIMLSIFLTYRIGVAGPIWGTVIAYTIFGLIPMTVYLFGFKIRELTGNKE